MADGSSTRAQELKLQLSAGIIVTDTLQRTSGVAL